MSNEDVDAAVTAAIERLGTTAPAGESAPLTGPPDAQAAPAAAPGAIDYQALAAALIKAGAQAPAAPAPAAPAPAAPAAAGSFAERMAELASGAATAPTPFSAGNSAPSAAPRQESINPLTWTKADIEALKQRGEFRTALDRWVSTLPGNQPLFARRVPKP